MKLLVIVFLLLSFNSFSQVQYEVSKDPENGLKTLKGILSRELLLNDADFAWMKNDISWYKPNADCVTNLTAVKDTIQLLVFVEYLGGLSSSLVEPPPPPPPARS